MPIRGDGRRLAELCSWCAILRRIPHRAVSDVWDMESGEDLWDAAAKCFALGEAYVSCRGTVALIRALQMTMERELEFCTKMGMRDLEKDNLKCAFEKAAETVMKMNIRTTDLIACTHDEEGGLAVMMPIRNELFLPNQDIQCQTSCLSNLDVDLIRQWRDRFRATCWVITEDDLVLNVRGPASGIEPETNADSSKEASVIMYVPENVKENLRALLCYPSQAKACVEVLDAIVRTHRGVKRFITGPAGRGKSFVKKTLMRILRSAGLTVKVLAVAAIVAQDDEHGQGSTVASAFNKRASDSTFDRLALEHAKTDVFFFDEISMASENDARSMTEFLARGEYMRAEGYLLNNESRKRRKERNVLPADEDPYFGAKIIVFGDFMQLEPPGGIHIYGSERLWGNVFRRRTLFLRESVRSSDPELVELCDMVRNFSGTDVSCGKDIVSVIRSRTVLGISSVPVRTTILSPRFRRAKQFAAACLDEAGRNEDLCDTFGWSREVFSIQCDDYVVRNRSIRLEQCIGMDNEDALEAKKAVLDKDHTRLRKFSFRLVMVAVVTENGAKRASQIATQEEDFWPEIAEECSRTQGNSKRTETSHPDADRDRLLNGVRVKIVGLLKKRGNKLCGVTIKSADGRWRGERAVKKTASKGQGLKKPSMTESRSVKFIGNDKEKYGVVTRSQVRLVL